MLIKDKLYKLAQDQMNNEGPIADAAQDLIEIAEQDEPDEDELQLVVNEFLRILMINCMIGQDEFDELSELEIEVEALASGDDDEVEESND